MNHTATPQATSISRTLKALLVLMKPGIVLLSLVAGWTGVYIGSNGAPNEYIVLWSTAVLGISTAGACALNNFLDRDIDAIMQRTAKRGIPSGDISPRMAYIFGTSLVVLSLFISKFYLGNLVTLLTGVAIFTYVVLYTFLKRTTPMATHIGGISGALPPMIGYAAAHNSIDSQALILFLIIIVWQQPHFWVLSLKYKDDYASASVPILAVAMGVQATKVRMLWYTVALYPVVLLPYLFNMAGMVYVYAAMILTTIYTALTVRFHLSSRDKEMPLFFFSIFYLAVLYAFLIFDMVVDA